MSDYYNIIDSAAELAEKRGREAGMAEGLARGREEGILEMAKNMKLQGLPVDVIQKVTGLPSDVCESL